MNQAGNDVPINPFTAIRAHRARIYSSMGNPLAVRGLTITGPFFTKNIPYSTFLKLTFCTCLFHNGDTRPCFKTNDSTEIK